MCLGLAGRIVETAAGDDIATVDIAGVRRPISLALLEERETVTAGSWVLVHMGFALQVMSDEEAAEAVAVLGTYAEERT